MNVVCWLSNSMFGSQFSIFFFFAGVDSLRHIILFSAAFLLSTLASILLSDCTSNIFILSCYITFSLFLLFMGFGGETVLAERDVFSFFFSATWITAHVHTMR